ncbi:MAG TPA: hypothetical protein PKH17_03770 [Candidatus Syntrophosphaera sp.]|nr:hypothetical protein [Candidatus Syntrophosphaera sp.]
MRELKDLSNRKIIMNYVEMAPKYIYCAIDIVQATGVCSKTVRNELLRLEKKGIIKRSKKKIEKTVYYRTITDDERIKKEREEKSVAEIAKERGCSRETIYKKFRSQNKGINLSVNQREVLEILAEGEIKKEWQIGYHKTLQTLLRKELVGKNAEGYWITIKGKAIVEALRQGGENA